MKHSLLAALTLSSLALSGLVFAADGLGKSGILPANFDLSVRPQDDLFGHVNGGWMKSHEIPADKSSYGVDGILDDRNLDWLKTIVEKASLSTEAGSEARKIGDLYAAYMDEATLNKLGAAPVAPLIARVEKLKSKAELPQLLAEFDLLGAGTPVGAYVHPDARDASRYSLDLFQSGLGMPDRDFYFEKGERFAKLRQAYLTYATQLFTLAGEKAPLAQAKAAFAFETALAKQHWTKVANRDPVKTYNPMTVKALARSAPGFDWAGWLAANELKVSDLVVSQPSYLKAFARQQAAAPLPMLKSYYKLQVLSAYAPYLSQAFYDAAFAYKQALTGVKQPRPRWQRAIGVVETSVGEALGKLYVAEHFPEASKAKVKVLVANLLTAYAAEIDTLDWMGPETKAKAKEKLGKFTVKVGYPDKWRDYSGLQIVAGDLIGNLQRANAFETRYNRAKLGQPIDKTEWQMTPQTINAYYDPQHNEIVFPAAILQAPYYDPEADDAANYGAIGSVIGHEVTHGFDDEGSQFDGDGNLKSWWTAEDRKRFEAKAAALVAQFDAYEPVKGVHINGKLTLGENIADLGGLIMAFNAWKLSLHGAPSPVIDGVSGEQRFFAGYAQGWMTKRRDEAVATQLKSDPHSPEAYRVNGVVVNVPAFQQTYATKPGDSLYRSSAQQVSIW